MFSYIIKPSKSLCFVPESSVITKIQKDSYVLMKLEPHIILKLFLNLGDLSFDILVNFYSYKKIAPLEVFISHSSCIASSIMNIRKIKLY